MVNQLIDQNLNASNDLFFEKGNKGNWRIQSTLDTGPAFSYSLGVS